MAHVFCTACGTLRDGIAERFAGKQTKCRQCGKSVVVAAAVASLPMPLHSPEPEDPAYVLPNKRVDLGKLFALASIVFGAMTIAVLVYSNWNELKNQIIANPPGILDRRRPPAPAKMAFDDSVILNLVRNHLEENTNTGDWEEVRVWPSIPVTEKIRTRIWDAVTTTGQFVDDAQQFNSLTRTDPASRLFMIKYRTKNVFGGMQLFQQTFVFLKGDVVELPYAQNLLIITAWDSIQPN